MIGYKAFNPDLTCKGFQYEIGKTYKFDGEIEICKAGFHFCENIADCFAYYSSLHTRFARVEALGTVLKSDWDSKCVTDKIRIIEEIPLHEAVKMTNTGNRNIGYKNTGNQNTGFKNSGSMNSGNCNIGNCNTGEWNVGNRNIGSWNSGNQNTGDWNAGYQNTGDWNVGDWNTGDCNVGDFNSGNSNTGTGNTGNQNTGDWNKSSSNTGCFMTSRQTIMMFDKPTDWTIDDWHTSRACKIMGYCPPDTYTNIKWISSAEMTDEEKEKHPVYRITDGYLKVEECKGDRQEWWDGLSDDDKQDVIDLPNFDADIFYECTGIKV
jgi:hypothetical protein